MAQNFKIWLFGGFLRDFEVRNSWCGANSWRAQGAPCVAWILKFGFLADFGARILGVNFKNRANFWRVSLRQILKSGVIFVPRI